MIIFCWDFVATFGFHQPQISTYKAINARLKYKQNPNYTFYIENLWIVRVTHHDY